MLWGMVRISMYHKKADTIQLITTLPDQIVVKIKLANTGQTLNNSHWYKHKHSKTFAVVARSLSHVRLLQPHGLQHTLANGIIHHKILLYQGDPSLKISW